MKKLTCLFILSAVIGYASAQQSTSASPVLQYSKAQLLSFTDIKPILSAADNGKDYSKYFVQSFRLIITVTENTSKGVINSTYNEWADGGSLTERQRSLLEKYGKPGVVFMLSEIMLVESGNQLGTIYDPAKDRVFRMPDFSVTVKE